MKKLMLIIAVLFGMLSVSARDNYSHDINILPEQAQSVISKNFNAEVSHIKIGKEFGKIRKYDVVLTDGSEICFDKHGVWNEVEVGRASEVPMTMILPPIARFIHENQGKAKVTGIEKKAYGYEVELSNGVDIRFTPKGKFIRYED